MSARSASARKKVTETHSKSKKSGERPSRSRARSGNAPDLSTHYENYPVPSRGDGYAYDPGFIYPPPPNRAAPAMSVSGHSNGSSSQSAPSEVDVGGDGSGIERSGLRSILDKRSDDVRKGLTKAFTFKKKEKDYGGGVTPLDRPESAATVRGFDGDGFGYDEYSPGSSFQRPPMPHQYPTYSYPSPHQLSPTSPQDPREMSWPGPPPSTKLPPVPQPHGPPMKRFVGGGRQATRWNKLRKDPELWDPDGDVLVYLGHRGHGEPPSLRLSSHVIEATRNRYLVTQLRESFVDNPEDLSVPDRRSSYWGQPTPPLSESDETIEGDISYEMAFPSPPSNNRTDMIRHQITTRNIFALIYRSPLVGMSMHQALSDLHARLEKYHCTGEADPAAQIVRYITARSLDDTRNDPEAAVSLLAWAEKPGVQWTAGWREAFLQGAGMYSHKLERCTDWKSVAPLTRALLERSWLEMRLRVQTAEERLAEFSFGDMWSNSNTGPGSPGTARAASERLRNFLISHYGQTYGSWPPSSESHDDEEMWLTRSVATSLQQDFGALYDYLVDRDVFWDVSEARAGRKWMMASKGANRGFEADIPGMPMTDILIEYDNRARVPHIPHPHPLLPESIPAQITAGGGMFKSSSQGQRHAGRERRVALSYTESTNIDALGSSYASSSLVDAFSRFEKGDCVGEIDPQTARRGRWVLLYGILQTLAAVSVDAPGAKHTANVPYHLNAKVKKPAWSREGGFFVDAKHEISHCWTSPQRWDEEEEDAQQETLNTLSRSPPGMSTSASETGSSVRTSSSHAARRQPYYGHEVELPLRRRETMVSRQESTPSISSMGSFLALDDSGKRGRRGHEAYSETPLLNRGMSPMIRDFDAEP